ncbi:MAG: DUF1501 domain-containing protein [Planctomycetes bacterium]|nr:DUF1501 domain-containing protein [Planctomycetota bacterium]
MNPTASSRRRFLASSAAAAGALALPRAVAGSLPWLEGLLPRLGTKTEHVVLVAFAGGVRKQDVLDAPQNVPNLLRIAAQGVTCPAVRVENVGHYGAALSIFTGRFEAMGIRENEPGLDPTIFERLRKDHALAAGDVWLSTASGAQGRLFAASAHPQYGPDYAANLLDGDGIFNPELKKVLDGLGKPKPEAERERELLERLSGAIDESALVLPQGQRAPDPQDVQRVAGFVLDQLAGRNAQISGPGAADAKAIRTGTDLLRVFKPRVLGITLQSADVAHGSYNAYVEVIRRNDEELGRLWDAIQQDDALRDTTAVFVLPEFGRDQDLNERNGLDHGDGSKALLEVFLIAAGPDFKRGKVLKDELRSIDVCPTVLALFGERAARGVDGKVIRGLFA